MANTREEAQNEIRKQAASVDYNTQMFATMVKSENRSGALYWREQTIEACERHLDLIVELKPFL